MKPNFAMTRQKPFGSFSTRIGPFGSTNGTSRIATVSSTTCSCSTLLCVR
jgi:hypothetical protein